MFKNNPIINLFNYSWLYSWGNRRNYVIFVALSILANIVMLAQPLVLGRIFNSIQFSLGNPSLITSIFINLSFLILIVLVFWALHGSSRVMEVKNAYLVKKNYQTSMISKVLNLPVSWHKDHHS